MNFRRTQVNEYAREVNQVYSPYIQHSCHKLTYIFKFVKLSVDYWILAEDHEAIMKRKTTPRRAAA